jgi:ABC-2 type transporter
MMCRQVAHLGVTVAAVIHQPGAQLFAGLDDLLLLGRGGRSVYYGPQAGVQAYFESIGFVLPERVCFGRQQIDTTGLALFSVFRHVNFDNMNKQQRSAGAGVEVSPACWL